MRDNWQRVLRCKDCGAIYKAGEIPKYCVKCGAELRKEVDSFTAAVQSLIEPEFKGFLPTDHSEFVVARRRFFTWEVKEYGNL